MQVFEFHFNPRLRQGGQTKLEPDLIFDSFCYEPENIHEKKLGGLYMVGLLNKVLPKNLKFLEKLSRFVKEKYYKYSRFGAEKSLKETLKETNGFLEEIIKKGDVSWLGNLNFAVLSFKNFNLNFTKAGSIKILLLRGKKLIDIDKKLKFQDIEPYPLKIFSNIISGKLAEEDLILVFTKEVYDVFQKENLIAEIASLEQFSAKGVKGIFNGKKEVLSKISGIFLVIVLKKGGLVDKKELISPQILKNFSFMEFFSPILKLFKFFKKPVLPSLNFRKKIKVKTPKINFQLRKKVILILALIIIIILGIIISKFEEEKKIQGYQKNLNEIENKLNLAESYLILENPQIREKANSLLKESFEAISPLLKEVKSLPKDFQNQVFALNDKISNELLYLNKLENVENPELFFEFKPNEYIPQKFLISDNNIYFFSPYGKNLFKLSKDKKGEVLPIDKKFNSATTLEDSILFLTKPNQLTILNKGEFSSFSLQEPYPDFSFDDVSSFGSNLYFLDKKDCKIIKYSYLKELKWGKPEIWLENPTLCQANSIAIDGSVWVLEKDNSISKYYAGNFREKITPDIFPQAKDFSKIFTSHSLPYLYILEPAQKRIVILEKNGKIFKQFQSDKFDNLLDFAVSDDGKTIYLLNGLKVYKINL